MTLTVPAIITNYLTEVEGSNAPIGIVELYSKLHQQIPKDSTFDSDEKLGLWAEINAFQFHPHFSESREPWNTYFVPMGSGQKADGTVIYWPDAKEITPEILDYWKARAVDTTHPTLKARYADLAWEFSALITPQNRDNTFVIVALDAYLAAIRSNLSTDEHQDWEFIERAIELALEIKDTQRIEAAKAALFDIYRRHFSNGKHFMWWHLSDIAWGHKRLPLSDVEQETVVESLEQALKICTDKNNAERFDPHLATGASDRLAEYYKRIQKNADAKRVVLTAGKAFEEVSANASGMVAVAWLEKVLQKYREIGLAEDAVRVEQLMRQRGRDAVGEMQRIEVSVPVDREEYEAELERLVSGTTEEVIQKITITFLLNKETVQNTVRELAKTAPFTSHINHSVTHHFGYTTATVGSVKDDFDGRTMRQAADYIGLSSMLLHHAFERLKKTHKVTPQGLVDFLNKANHVTENNLPFLQDGITAWMNGDHVKAIHLLTPQVEAILRTLAAMMGISIMRPHRSGGFEVIGMSKILHDKGFKERFDEDTWLHLAALYADPRGLNIRNEIAHGLMRHDRLRIDLSNWVMHTLLFLSMLKPKALEGSQA